MLSLTHTYKHAHARTHTCAHVRRHAYKLVTCLFIDRDRILLGVKLQALSEIRCEIAMLQSKAELLEHEIALTEHGSNIQSISSENASPQQDSQMRNSNFIPMSPLYCTQTFASDSLHLSSATSPSRYAPLGVRTGARPTPSELEFWGDFQWHY